MSNLLNRFFDSGVVDDVILYLVSFLFVLSLVLLIISRKKLMSAKRARMEYGIPNGDIIYTDLDKPAKALFSSKFQISGKPDYIVKDKQQNVLVPVEIKSKNAKKPHWGHVLQLGAYCLLIEEVYNVSVPFGILVYADGKQHKIKFDKSLRHEVLSVADEMRTCLKNGYVDKGTRFEGRCRYCSVRDDCNYKKVSDQ
jgi:CRISPR-associated exonuclease Cas4